MDMAHTLTYPRTHTHTRQEISPKESTTVSLRVLLSWQQRYIAITSDQHSDTNQCSTPWALLGNDPYV